MSKSNQKKVSSCQNLANRQITCHLHVKQRSLHFSNIQLNGVLIG